MKTKLKLKTEVKETLIVIGIIGVLVVLFAALNNMQNKAVESCVSAGNSITYCENGLK